MTTGLRKQIEEAAHKHRDPLEIYEEDWVSFSSFKCGAEWLYENHVQALEKKIAVAVNALHVAYELCECETAKDALKEIDDGV